MGPRILWALLAGCTAGVFVRSFVQIGWADLGFIVVLSAAGALLAALDKRKRHGIVIACAALAFCGGVVRMHSAIVIPDAVLLEYEGSAVTLEGRVFDEPDARESSVRLFVHADALIAGTSTVPLDAGVLVVAPLHTEAQYGDRVRAKGTLRVPEKFDTGGREFDHPQFLAKDGITFELAFVRDVEIIEGGRTNPLKAGAIWIKRVFLQGLAAALPEPHAGLAGGITMGDKRGLGEELSETFRIVGLIHIVVLSGYNIMIVMEWLSRILARMRVSRYVRFGTSVAVAVLFALMTGLAAASVRAAAMATIALLGRLTGRMYLASRALGVVAVAMMLWNPYILVFDPGFQLSVLATAGLIAFTPRIISKLKAIPYTWGLREIAASTIATQLAVLPLLLYQNGQIPVYSFFVNLLALAIVPLAMLLSAIAALGGLILGPLAPIAGFPAYAALSYIIGVADLFAALPFSSISLPAFSAWLLLPVYGGMLLLFLTYGRTRESRQPEADHEQAYGR